MHAPVAGPREGGRPLEGCASGALRAQIALIRRKTSPSSGNRPTWYFEKTSDPSTMTSKMPFEPLMSLASMPSSFFSSAARPAARGR